MGKPTGNWINDDVQYAIEWPEYPRNVEKAKQLLREAGYPNGFDVDWVTPLPAFYSRGERLIAHLREVGIRGRLQTMERGIFFQRLQGGLKEFQGDPDHPARGADRRQLVVLVRGPLQVRRLQLARPHLREGPRRQVRPVRAVDQSGRAQEARRGDPAAILENYYLVPVFRHAFVNAIGPKVAAQKWQDVFPTITTGYAYPWEDLKVKDQ